MKRTTLAIALSLAVSITAAQGVVKIAVIEPLSGPMAGNGTDIVERFQFLFDRINAQGGLAGRKVEVKGYDNGFDVEKTAQQMRRAADDGVTYVIHGIGPQHAEAIRSFLARHNTRNPGKEMAYLAHSVGSNDLTNEKCDYYQATFDPTVEMKVMALVDSVRELKLGTKVFLVNPNFEFGQVVEASAKKVLAAKAPGLTLVGSELVAPFGQVQDFTPLVAKIKASGANVVITGNFGPDLIRLVSAAADSGLPARFATLYGLDPSAMGAIGRERMLRAGVGVVTEYHENDTGKLPVLEALNKDYRARNGTSWGIDRYRFLAEMLSAAAKKAGSADAKAVMKALEGVTVATAAGEGFMRADDHQLIQPYVYVDVDPKPAKTLLWKGSDVGFAFKTTRIVPRSAMALPTTCKMKRP